MRKCEKEGGGKSRIYVCLNTHSSPFSSSEFLSLALVPHLFRFPLTLTASNNAVFSAANSCTTQGMFSPLTSVSKPPRSLYIPPPSMASYCLSPLSDSLFNANRALPRRSSLPYILSVGPALPFTAPAPPLPGSSPHLKRSS